MFLGLLCLLPFSGTPLQPVVSGSSPHTPYTGYTPIPTIESPGQQDNGTAASRVAANTAVSAPPAYNEALNPMVYPPPPVRSTQTTTDLVSTLFLKVKVPD